MAHLCKECGTTKLIYDVHSLPLANAAKAVCSHPLDMYDLPSIESFQHHDSSTGSPTNAHIWPVNELDIAYYHHSSGTSGSLPKLLPVTHKMAIGVLAHEGPSPEATFSTTPIYHGGVADCFRSWAATSQIWLYPGEVAMTGKVLQQCVAGAQHAYMDGLAHRLAYISCVPVVLCQFAESFEGLEMLKSMRMVGVGGAAMPEQIATHLVDEGVHLVSRYGTTECGFLLSSYRSFEEDKEWQYLRHEPTVKALHFEQQADGLAELVADATWPALVKSTREDGSFATKDLFKPHPRIPNAWQYHSRADSQITLSTGKKFDPTPSEDSIRQSDLLEDILIFGDNHTFPGALLFTSPQVASAKSNIILDQLWIAVQENNLQAPKHANLHKSMLFLMPPSSSGLPKSSKGTTLRKQAVERYKIEIEGAYTTARFREEREDDNTSDLSTVELQHNQVIAIISEIVKTTKEGLDNLTIEDDFFNHGIDSTDCVRIREKIQARLIPSRCPKLPLDVVYDHGNIAKLSEMVINIREGNATDLDDELQLMRDLVATHSNWQISNSEICNGMNKADSVYGPGGREVVLMTGVTGTLGAHVLSQLTKSPSIVEIHCLVRGASVTSVQERVRKSLLHRQLQALDTSTSTIHFHPCNLSQPDLGLTVETFNDLANRVTLIIHAAWTVNFATRLPSFVKDNIVGLHNLISLTVTSSRSTPPRFVFCSSTASAMAFEGEVSIPEYILDDPRVASPIGYSRSKWVAEQICNQAHHKTYLKNHISVLRIGQLCGDTSHGVWNVKEAWPLMLSSSMATGCLPDLDHEPLDWLPVDKAARALLEIAMPSQSGDAIDKKKDASLKHVDRSTGDFCHVYNLVNQSRERTWIDLLGWMRKTYPSLETVPPATWLSRLEGLEKEQETVTHRPWRVLLGFWRSIYGVQRDDGKPTPRSYDMLQTREASRTMRDICPISEAEFLKMWAWIQDEWEKEP